MLGKSVNVLLRISEIKKLKNIGRYIGISDFKTQKYLYRYPSKSFIGRALMYILWYVPWYTTN